MKPERRNALLITGIVLMACLLASIFLTYSNAQYNKHLEIVRNDLKRLEQNADNPDHKAVVNEANVLQDKCDKWSIRDEDVVESINRIKNQALIDLTTDIEESIDEAKVTIENKQYGAAIKQLNQAHSDIAYVNKWTPSLKDNKRIAELESRSGFLLNLCFSLSRIEKSVESVGQAKATGNLNQTLLAFNTTEEALALENLYPPDADADLVTELLAYYRDQNNQTLGSMNLPAWRYEVTVARGTDNRKNPGTIDIKSLGEQMKDTVLANTDKFFLMYAYDLTYQDNDVVDDINHFNFDNNVFRYSMSSSEKLPEVDYIYADIAPGTYCIPFTLAVGNPSTLFTGNIGTPIGSEIGLLTVHVTP